MSTARTPPRRPFRPGDRIFRVPRARPWQVVLPAIPKPRLGGVSTMVLIYGFAAIILVGTILLMLPFSTRTGTVPHPVTALFTATSATCVTGLVVVDTFDYWSTFGQAVILILIQLGGFGFMTTATLFLLATGRRIGLRERLLIREALGISRLGGVVRIVREMAVFTILSEILGTALVYLHLSTQHATGEALWKSVFQSISAFNNAGFDLFGRFHSMVPYQTNVLMVLTTAGLIILGGISYLVVADVIRNRGFARISLDSKLVITTSLALLALGTLVILLTEFANESTLAPLSFPHKILNAFFQSATSRTAGFSTIDISNLAVYSLFFTIFLMFVGGAAGSTAGGIKVNTFGMLIATVLSTIQGKETPGAFGREISTQQIHRALTLAILAVVLISVVSFTLTITEPFRFLDLLFETVSAFGTVGLSTGITPLLSIGGQLLIIATMFVGRLGPLALVISLIQRQRPSEFRYPKEPVRIG